MFVDKVNITFEKWPQLTPKVLDHVKQTVKDKSIQKLLSLADAEAEIGMLNAICIEHNAHLATVYSTAFGGY